MMKVVSATFGQLQNNCYIIEDETTKEAALIDCTEWNEKMERFTDGYNIKYILLTHGHFDHIGGVAKGKEKLGAKVAISKEDENMLTSSRYSLAAFSGISQENATADIVLSDGDKITLGETEIEVMATPGHTKGGVCYITDDAIFCGDTLFFCSCGRTDFPGGSADEISKSLKKIASIPANLTVYPGHDRTSTLDFERENNPFMR